MGLVKKIESLISKYEDLRGREKEAVRESMEKLKKEIKYVAKDKKDDK